MYKRKSKNVKNTHTQSRGVNTANGMITFGLLADKILITCMIHREQAWRDGEERGFTCNGTNLFTYISY